MAGKYGFMLDQGATWRTVLAVDVDGIPLDLTGYTARMQARSTVTDAETVFSWTSTGGELLIDGPAGTITLNIPDTVTAAYAAGAYVYDLEIESADGTTTRLLQGPFTISAEVTR